jgi:hypothetical protein
MQNMTLAGIPFEAVLLQRSLCLDLAFFAAQLPAVEGLVDKYLISSSIRAGCLLKMLNSYHQLGM